MNIQETYSYLDLLALATVADIVPMIDENRIYTYYGLKKINQNPSIGLECLIKKLSRKNKITSSDISFGIAPLINAAGRISHAKNAFKLLIETDTGKVEKYSDVLYANNQERKIIEKNILHEALKKINKKNSTNVVSSKNWHKGVIGIVASRLIENYYRPTVVLTKSEELMVGSVRSVDGFDVYEALEACKQNIFQFGGHKYSAGLTLLPEKYNDFNKTNIQSGLVTFELQTGNQTKHILSYNPTRVNRKTAGSYISNQSSKQQKVDYKIQTKINKDDFVGFGIEYNNIKYKTSNVREKRESDAQYIYSQVKPTKNSLVDVSLRTDHDQIYGTHDSHRVQLGYDLLKNLKLKTSFGTGQASAHTCAQNGAAIYGSGWFFTA